MQFDYVDNKIKAELHESCYTIQASENLKHKIDNKIEEELKKECYDMNRNVSKKKITVAAFAACLFVTINCLAAGKIQSLVGSSNTNDAVNDFTKIEEEEKNLGYDVKAVEAFSNGYTFQEMLIDNIKGLDEEGNEVAEYKDLDITYEKEGKTLSVDISKGIPNDEEQAPVETRQINGIQVNYSLDTYKFVPEDYQLTEEDNENQKKEHYYISYGSDEIKIQKFSSLSWEEDGVSYLMSQFDSDLSIDELIDMANQVIESK